MPADTDVFPAPDVRADGAGSGARARRALTKVPEITIFFWITKVLTTAMGEATSDFMNQALGPAIAVPIMLVGLTVALKIQLRARTYSAWPYWFVVIMVAVFGTSAADALHVGFGIAYPVSSAFYLVVLAAIFTAWYRSERTLSIHSIYTARRERFYWGTVLATFALGTAAGDMTATSMHLGFLSSGVLFGSLIALPAFAYRRLGLNSIAAFWFAYVMTRPLGASFADWLDTSHRVGGLNWGAGPVAVGLAVAMLAFIAYLAITRIDVQRALAGAPQATPTATTRAQPVLDLELD
ncbi:MAG: putative rane-anchored protein [Solirubrobacterales bacterium]|nr:putative rane-anchored protein [Solirubrobacterales bacterium]